MCKFYFRLVIPAIMSILLPSCRKSAAPPDAGDGEGKDPVEVSLNLRCKPFTAESRSSYNPCYEEYVYDLNVFVYKDSRLVPGSTYYSDLSVLPVIRFPDSDSRYDVFFLANMGRQHAPEEESVLKESSFDLSSVSSFVSSGLPMAAFYEDVGPSDCGEVYLVHLVGAFDISFSNSSSVTQYTIKSLRLKNSARDLHPFSSAPASGVDAEGDFLSEDDIALLNDGGTVRLYFTENLQGTLLEGNTDPLRRIPSNLGAAAGLCSYIEITADAATPTALYHDNVYRAYLGANLRDDFNIERNLCYTLNLDYESDMIKEKEWIVTPGPYDVTGSIGLSADEIVVFASLESDELSGVDIEVPDGAEYTVSVPDSRIKLLSTASSRVESSTGRTLYSGAGHFTFRSEAPMSNTVCGAQPSSESLEAVVETSDGILRDTLTLRHYTSGFPIRFKYEDGSLWIRASNPLQRRVKVFFGITCSKSDGSWSGTGYDSVSLVPGSSWTQLSTVPGTQLSLASSHLPDRCLVSMSVSFPDFAGVDILNPGESTMPFYIANMPDMIPSKGPSLVRNIGQYSVNRGFDGLILSCPPSGSGPSDPDWHSVYVDAELSNVSDASSFMVADQTVITDTDVSVNPCYLRATDKYVVISSSGMDLGLCYEYAGSWYDFRNVMRLSSVDATEYPVLAHFGHSLPYMQYEELNRSLSFTVNSQSWWYAFGVDAAWFAQQ